MLDLTRWQSFSSVLSRQSILPSHLMSMLRQKAEAQLNWVSLQEVRLSLKSKSKHNDLPKTRLHEHLLYFLPHRLPLLLLFLLLLDPFPFPCPPLLHPPEPRAQRVLRDSGDSEAGVADERLRGD